MKQWKGDILDRLLEIKDHTRPSEPDSAEEEAVAKAYLETCTTWPQVVKADGLAAGKGVAMCETSEDAQRALEERRDVVPAHDDRPQDEQAGEDDRDERDLDHLDRAIDDRSERERGTAQHEAHDRVDGHGATQLP